MLEVERRPVPTPQALWRRRTLDAAAGVPRVALADSSSAVFLD